MTGTVEMNECSFCHQVKPVTRTYLHPSKYVKPEDPEIWSKLYNQGSYFIIIWHCEDCGPPNI